MPASVPDTSEPRGVSRRAVVLGMVAVAMVLTVLATSQDYARRLVEHEPASIWRSAVPAFVTWFFWVAVAPGVLALVRRLPLRRRGWPRIVGVHVAIAIAVAFLHGAVVVAVSRATYLPPLGREVPRFTTWYGQYMRFQFQVELFTYLGVLGIAFAVDYYDRFRRGQQQAAALRAQLAAARLAALKAQLHPHFLFNTLNAITVLIRDDPEAAMRTMALLGDFLRVTLGDSDAEEVPLEREIAFLELYLEIERTRFPDRLDVTFAIAPDVRSALVPHFLLQPLVENAIRYGVARHEGLGRVVVSARREGASLAIVVWNDGSRLPPDAARREGIGLSSTRTRVATMYGERGSLTLDEADGGVRARVALPYRTPMEPGDA